MNAVRHTVLGIALVAIGGLVLALVIGVRGPAMHDQAEVEALPSMPSVPVTASPAQAQTPGATAELTAQPGEGAPAPTVDDILQARADSSADAMSVLLAGVESSDAVVVAESTNALVARGAVGALPVLIDHDVLRRPAAAPSIIDAIGRLSAVAAPEQRAEAVDHLVALLREEKTRGAVESQGNTIQIYEALGQTGDARAIGPLETELQDPTVPTAPKVVIVQALVALRATRSIGILERLQTAIASSTAVGFEAELQRDLLAAIHDALARLS